MSKRHIYVGLWVAWACTSVALFMAPAFGQSAAAPPAKPEAAKSAAQKPKVSTPESDLQDQVAAVKAENAAIREQLRRMEEQQKALLVLIDDLRRKLGSAPIAETPRPEAAVPPAPPAAAPALVLPAESPAPPPAAAEASAPEAPAPELVTPPVQTAPKRPERYRTESSSGKRPTTRPCLSC